MRRLFLIPLFLTLGALATTAIAWSCVATGELRILTGQMIRPPNPKPGGIGWLAPEHLDWPIPVPPDWPHVHETASSRARGLRWAAASTAQDPPMCCAQSLSAGWPFLTLRWTELRTVDAAGVSIPKTRGQGPLLDRATAPGYPGTLSNWLWHLGAVPRRLPLAPIWPAFILSSLAWATVLAAATLPPLRAARKLRRARRLRRGDCPACGYALSGLPACPECGQTAAPPTV